MNVSSVALMGNQSIKNSWLSGPAKVRMFGDAGEGATFAFGTIAVIHAAIIRPAGVAIGAYHGYKRHGSVGAAIGWGVLGACFPIITSAVAFAQGIDKAK